MNFLATARSLDFIWPSMLWLLALAPLLAWTYTRLVARRRAEANRYASLETAGAAAYAGWKRHLPASLLLIAIVAMLAAIARPQANVILASHTETVVLAIDASGSMRATDVKPTRLKAAQLTAKSFVENQPSTVRVGIVATAGNAALVQSPTRNREEILQAIERLQPQPGSALGSGIVIALVTLLPDAGIDAEEIINGRRSRPAPPMGEAPKKAEPKARGSETSAVIVLIADGANNMGPDMQKAAQVAADHGVRVFTIGVGTPEGSTLSVDGWSVRVRLEEDPLKKVALATGGEYFRAASENDLKKIYAQLGSRVALEKQQSTEITALFAGIGALLAMLAATLSMLWFNRIL